MRIRILALAGIIFGLAILAVGCSSRSSPPDTQSSTPGDALSRVQHAINSADGYTIDVQQKNFVLPRWGGADGGVVYVGDKGAEARATLARTGEQDATYNILVKDDKTYFQRSTCDQAFQVPGEANVLQPYMFATNDLLSSATAVSVEGSTIMATTTSLGRTTIKVDPETMRPTVISGSNASGPIVWTFKQWKSVKLVPPAKIAGERGPGGIPC